MTLVATLSIDGVTASYVIDGAMNGPAFLAPACPARAEGRLGSSRFIEDACAKIEPTKGAACTVDALWNLVGRTVKATAPSECAGYLRHAGYRASFK